ncbi:glycosyltransferase [Campylobacter sp. 2018MI01]|uniref:glycosyltransferase family 2 protein n=1 Tax=Campylobacter sp. 2018MI01 TaxID=2836735 RepID=UPI001BD946C7|nr:glycosyltransferase [Campylobacter sp. 2018MI01]MBT0879462.1 glycosyltransferase [Campylobacter sp. 2018MI01]
MSMKISVCIIAKNEEKNLKRCLNALADFDEIVLVDNESTDNSVGIAKEFKNVKVFSSPFIGFGKLKQFAVNLASNDWVFCIDADEVIDFNSLELLKNLDFSDITKIYAINRKNYYKNEWIKTCGFYPDYIVRIFNKTHTNYDDANVHENIIIKNNSQLIKTNIHLHHFAFNSIYDLITKLQRYTEIYAQNNKNKKTSTFKAISHGFFTFFKFYFLKLGIKDGFNGFIISLCNALGSFFKYAKLKDAKIPTCSLIITTYNDKVALTRCLEYVFKMTTLPDEIIIADDGGDNWDIIEKFSKYPVILKHAYQEDLGFRLARSRNNAIKIASGDFLVIIDSDMLVDNDFIKNYKNNAEKGVFLQGSRICLKENISKDIREDNMELNIRTFKANKINVLSKIIKYFSKIDKSICKKLKSIAQKTPNDKKIYIKGIRGCNMGFYKEDAISINGFNNDFEGWGREDSEFVIRFLNKGYKLKRLKHQAIAYHIYHKENERNLEQNHKIYLNTLLNDKSYCENGLEQI